MIIETSYQIMLFGKVLFVQEDNTKFNKDRVLLT